MQCEEILLHIIWSFDWLAINSTGQTGIVTIRYVPGAVAWSEACPLGMQVASSSIPTSGTFFRGDLVMKKFSLFRWFKKSSCQLLAKEWALGTGKLPRRLAQEQIDAGLTKGYPCTKRHTVSFHVGSLFQQVTSVNTSCWMHSLYCLSMHMRWACYKCRLNAEYIVLSLMKTLKIPVIMARFKFDLRKPALLMLRANMSVRAVTTATERYPDNH